MKKLNMLKWIVLVIVLGGTGGIFFLLTDTYDRDGRFYLALACLLISILVSTYVVDLDMLFVASKMNDFPQRMAFLTLSICYEIFVFLTIIIFLVIRPLEIRYFASIMIFWFILFAVLTYALLILNRFVSSNVAADRIMGVHKGELNMILEALNFEMQGNEICSHSTLLRQKLEDLIETVRYSDPVSREEVEELDHIIMDDLKKIQMKLKELNQEEQIDELVKKMHHTKGLVERRNSQLISLK